MENRVILIILDSAGVGFLPDAEEYGDKGANTLGHIGEAYGLTLPNMERIGLGKIIKIDGVSENITPVGAYGKAASKSKGKDTTIGHWEIAGIITDKPLPTFPSGFPVEIISEFEKRIGRKIIGNISASGTEIIERLGEEHCKTGSPIVYTSADSVFQIAAHEEVIPLNNLYKMCSIAREMFDEMGIEIGRVIARPFLGENSNFQRTSNRHDYSLKPRENLLTKLNDKGKNVYAVGKIFDIFAGEGINNHISTKSNIDGVEKTIAAIKNGEEGLIFTNLVDFDMKYGHRRDAKGYKNALEEFDAKLPEIIGAMSKHDLLIITADHGCDPIFKGSDHTREYVPVLAAGERVRSADLGVRESFADIGATIYEYLTGITDNKSFLQKIKK